MLVQTVTYNECNGGGGGGRAASPTAHAPLTATHIGVQGGGGITSPTPPIARPAPAQQGRPVPSTVVGQWGSTHVATLHSRLCVSIKGHTTAPP